MTPYEAGRSAARSKYAEAAHGALAGGLLGAALPTITNSVWERPLRSLGGATLGAIIARKPDTDALEAAAHTGLGHLGGSVVGGVLGGFGGAILEPYLPGALTANSMAPLGGVALGGTLGGLLGGALNTKRVEKKKSPVQPATLETP